MKGFWNDVASALDGLGLGIMRLDAEHASQHAIDFTVAHDFKLPTIRTRKPVLDSEHAPIIGE